LVGYTFALGFGFLVAKKLILECGMSCLKAPLVIPTILPMLV